MDIKRQFFNKKYVFLQKLTPTGEKVWKEPIKVATATDSLKNFTFTSVSDLKVDKRATHTFYLVEKDVTTGLVEPFYQVVNSDGKKTGRMANKLSAIVECSCLRIMMLILP